MAAPNAAVVARRPFARILELMPCDEAPLVVPVHPSVDGRAPLTYGHLQRFASEVASQLRDLGVPAGARIAASLPNGPELAVCLLALAHTFSFAPLNPDLGDDETIFELEDIPAVGIIVPAGRHSAAAKVAVARLGLPLILLTPDLHVCGRFALSSAPRNGDAPAAHADVMVTAGEPPGGTDAVALVMHTSGTTRRPKLVPLSHRHLGVGALCVRETLELQRTDVALNTMPLFHLHGLSINVLASAVAGGSVQCAPSFDAVKCLAWLQPTAAGALAVAKGAMAPGDAAMAGGQATTAADRARHGMPLESAPATPPATPLATVAAITTFNLAPTWYSAVPTIHQEVLRAAQRHVETCGTPPAHSLRLIRNCSAALPPAIATQLEAVMDGATVLTTCEPCACVGHAYVWATGMRATWMPGRLRVAPPHTTRCTPMPATRRSMCIHMGCAHTPDHVISHARKPTPSHVISPRHLTSSHTHASPVLYALVRMQHMTLHLHAAHAGTR